MYKTASRVIVQRGWFLDLWVTHFSMRLERHTAHPLESTSFGVAGQHCRAVLGSYLNVSEPLSPAVQSMIPSLQGHGSLFGRQSTARNQKALGYICRSYWSRGSPSRLLLALKTFKK